MFKGKRIISLLLAISMILSLGLVSGVAADEGAVEPLPIYQDKSYSFAERAADLVYNMTTAEKGSQMISGFSPAIPRLGLDWYGWWNEALHGVSRQQTRAAGNATTIQNLTSYPISMSMGSTWDPELMYRVSTQIGNEAREVVTTSSSYNGLTYWSPTVNLNRDPRWGRSDESFGEDPFLTAAIASQFVNGMEGKDMKGALLDPNGYQKTVSTIKHYMANNSESNRLNGTSNMTDREIREYYSYVYRLIVEQSDVSSVMASYNRVNEMPANINAYLLDTLLRQTFGFDGYVTSDCDSVWIAFTGSGYDASRLTSTGNGHGWRIPNEDGTPGNKITNNQTVAWAIAAGGDLDCNAGYSGRTGTNAFDYAQRIVPALAEKIITPNGLFDENTVDISLQRLMEARIRLGDLDASNGDVVWHNEAIERAKGYGETWAYASSATNGATTVTADRLALVREAGDKSLVLLKNDKVAGTENKLLPLQIPATGAFKVAVIGHFARPNATNNSMFLGGYSATMGASAYEKMITPYAGIVNAIKAVNPDAEVTFYKGFTGTGTTATTLTTIDEEAITAAAAADLCIVYAGTDSGSANEQNDRIGGITLPGAQSNLIKRVGEANPKTVAVMETISQNDVTDFVDVVPAMVWSCYNGMVKGQSLADVLTGAYNPSGRTSTVWFKNVAQLAPTRSYKLTPGVDAYPEAYNGLVSGEPVYGYTYGETNGRTYMYYDEAKGGAFQYPFGYGLSYSTFEYSNLNVTGLTEDKINANGAITVSVDVKNTSAIKGADVVQLYVATPGAPAEKEYPIKRLKGFEKVELNPGETKTVTLSVAIEDLAFFNEAAGKFEIYNGGYQIQIARTSANADIQASKNFEVTGALTAKVNVVSAKPNQTGDAERDTAQRLLFNAGVEVFPQLTISMNDDTLYGYVMKGQSKEIPANFTVKYASNRPSVAAVADDGTIVTTANKGVATITATVTDALSGSVGIVDFIVYNTGEAGPYASAIQVGGVDMAGFDSDTLEYTFLVSEDALAEEYEISATAGEENWVVACTQLDAIPGTATVAISSATATTVYTINYITKLPEEPVDPKDILDPPTNPIVKAIFTADPSARVWPTNPNKLYLYPSHDQDPAQGCDLMDKYHVYSTEDMVNWVDEGEIIRSEEVAWGRAEGGFMWAPDAAYKDGTYYFYYPHPTTTNWGSTWEVGVATSKYPNKGFVDQGPVKGATTRSDMTSEANRRDGMIDPNVFIDDDGTPYMFIGGSQRLYYGEMTPDLLSMKGSGTEALKRIPSAQVPSYHEGPWVFKRGNTYYLTYPGASTTVDGKRSDRMLYSTSDSVHGPWVPRGYFHNPVNTGDTSHGSVVEFKGRWFLFYHNAEVSGGTGNLRSVAVDELFFNEDGTIQMVVQTTTGPAAIEGVNYTAPKGTVYPASAATLAGGASFANNELWGQVISGLTSATRTATFENVDGGLGGRGTIKIRHANTARRTVKLIVNGFDWGYVNLMPTASTSDFTKNCEFTVTNLLPGAVNTIQLVGRQSGAFNVSQISVVPFNDYDEMNPADQAIITSVEATSPLAVGSAANVKYTITGENLAGKAIDIYFLGMDPVRVTANAQGVATGILRVTSEWMNNAGNNLLVQKDTDFNLAAKVVGEKAIAYAPVTLMPTNGIWDAWSSNVDGKLRVEFGADISSSKALSFAVEGVAKNIVSTDAYSVLTDVDFDTLKVRQEAIGENQEIPGTVISIKGVQFPMFPSFSFTFTVEVKVKPEKKDYSSSLATLGGAATRGNNGSSPTGVVIENLSNANSYAQWTIPAADVVKTGGYVLGVYYGTNDSSPSCNVIVNGTTLSPRLSMPGTGGWSNFTGHAEMNINLVEGQDNTVRLSIGTSSGQGFNVYKISLTRIP